MAGPIPHGGQVGITIDAKAALVKIGRVQAAFTVRQLLEAIGAKELRWTGLNLQEAGKTTDGVPWAHMAPMTLRMRPKRTSPYHFSSPYQQLLQQSMTSTVNEGASSVTIGTAARYALDHHLGVPARRLPARKLLAAAPVARAHALELMQAIVAKLVRETAT